ncbi:head decoration protein, partial [Fusobacterium mortiferum]|nr:head decoration protein [Fusobacterium mortiferum]
MDTSTEVNLASMFVAHGTINGNTIWTQTVLLPTIGIDALSFVQFSASLGGTVSSVA